MPKAILNRLLPYGVTILGIAVTLLLMLLLDPWLPMNQSPFLLFFGAVMVSAWYSGRELGIFATFLSALAANYFFINPNDGFSLDLLSVARTLIFMIIGILISFLYGALHTAQQRLQFSFNLLRVSELKFRRLVDSNIIGIVCCDTRGAITEANDAFLKMTGYTQEDVLTGRVRWDEMTPLDLRDRDIPALEELINTGKNTPYEKAFISKDGRRIPVMVGAALLEDESRENVISFVLDLSDRKVVEKALQESEERYRQIVETANEGIWLIDAEADVTYVNQRMAQMLGYSVEEMLGRSAFNFMYEQDRVEAERRLERRKQGVTEQSYFRLRCKDGSSIWSFSRTNPIFDDNGKLLGILAMVTDITEQHYIEQRQRLQYAVTRVLAEAITINDALPALLQSMCESLEWQVGIFWNLDRQANLLHYANAWHVPSLNAEDFTKAQQQTTFSSGVGLPGHVLATGEPTWIENVIEDENFPRVREANQAGLHGALAFPILFNQEILGVIECFSEQIQEPNADLLEMMNSLGSEIGQFIERKRTEQALAHSQQLFSSFMNHMPGTAFIKDEQGRYLYVNPMAVSLVNHQDVEILGKTDFEILPTQVAQRVREHDMAVLTQGEAIEILETLPQMDGEHYLMTLKFPIQDVSGNKMLAGMSFDVTEQKRTEAEIAELNKDLKRRINELQTLLDVIPIGIGIGVNPECSDIRPNIAFARWLNVPAGMNSSTSKPDAKHLPFKVYRQGRELPPHEQPIQYAAAHSVEVHNDELQIIHDNGTILYLLGNAAPLFDEEGKVRGSVGAFLDISDRKRTETILRFLADASGVLASSLDYQTTLENIARLAVANLADWCVIDILEEGNTSSKPAAIEGNPEKVKLVREFMRDYPLDLNSETHPLARVLRTGKSELVSECLEQNKLSMAFDQEHLRRLQALDIKSYICVPLIANTQTLGSMTLVYGESGRRYNLADLSLVEDLARRAALAVENAQLYQKAQEANRVKDEFLAVLSHELRSPLNPILGWAKILQSRKLDQTATNNALKIIERNANVQVQIVEDLLDVSRIIQGKLNLNISPVNLASVIEAAVETLYLPTEAKSIEISFDNHCSDNAIVLGDANRLQQIVWNLLSNAIKFTPNEGRVKVKLECLNTIAQIQISDTGKGINPNFLPYVFDYFRQENSATNRKFGGLGLGLAIVRRLVELHGGTVKADSQGEGLGATFTITLPLMMSETQTQSKNAYLDNTHILEGVKVLVVDDDADNLELITFILEDYQMKVRGLTAADQAISVLSDWQPDLLISDIGMPEMDGYALLRQIRSLPPEQGGLIPAIALTAYAGEINYQQALAAGFQKHVSKPVNPEELALVIANTLKPTS